MNGRLYDFVEEPQAMGFCLGKGILESSDLKLWSFVHAPEAATLPSKKGNEVPEHPTDFTVRGA